MGQEIKHQSSTLLTFSKGNPPVTGGLALQRAVMQKALPCPHIIMLTERPIYIYILLGYDF